MNKDILIIDNYDSFTYNLVQIVEELVNDEIEVVRNDAIDLDFIKPYSTIILSPGPGVPSGAGLLKDIIATYAPTKKILGVCLGLQAIGEVFGAQLRNLDSVFHGVATPMNFTKVETNLFRDIQSPFTAGRYHSWVIDKTTLPNILQITCLDDDSEIMAIQHQEYNIHAVQFHPESVLTPDGKKIIENFIFAL